MAPLILNLITRFGEAKNIMIILTCIKIMPICFEFNSLDLTNMKKHDAKERERTSIQKINSLLFQWNTKFQNYTFLFRRKVPLTALPLLKRRNWISKGLKKEMKR